MQSYEVALPPSTNWTSVLPSRGPNELSRAQLLPPASVQQEPAASTFFAGLALWLETRIPIVLSVGAQQADCCLGLSDERGIGTRSFFYRIEVSGDGN